jgi:hypothetical protein
MWGFCVLLVKTIVAEGGLICKQEEAAYGGLL